jgi:alpha-2-macroglobulin
MATAARFLLLSLSLLLFTHTARAADTLTIVNTGPHGETATLAETNEIRVVFSEPMVALGRIPPVVTAPFFTISPAVKGTFRWSGTTILIFTPDHVDRLPYATRYTVTIDTTAKAISGRTLAKPYQFEFTTPTVHLKETHWYRKAERYDSPMLIALRFNQPVKPADIAAHLRLAFKKHFWNVPMFTPEIEARLNRTVPEALTQFRDKVAAARRAAESTAPLTFTLAQTWDKKAFPPAPDLVVFEVTAPVPTESWIDLLVDSKVPSMQGQATPGTDQTFTIYAEPTFFIDNFARIHAVNPEEHNPIQFRDNVSPRDLRGLISVIDITDPAHETPVAQKPGPLRRDSERDRSQNLTLEDVGFASQPPARTYAVTIDPTLRAKDGQTLGYTWLGIVENSRLRAFTSFGDGHGVWESSGGPLLPFHARNYANVTQWVAPLQPGDLMPTLLMLDKDRFRTPPPGDGTPRKLAPRPDKIQSYGLNIASTLNKDGHGLVWAAVRPGEVIPKAHGYDDSVRATVVQSTNLGINVKDSPQNTLVFVTRLDNGEPVADARVSIVQTDNQTFWSGTTNRDGLVLAPNTRLRDPSEPSVFSFLVMAEKDGDVAYVGSDWDEGIRSWDFGLSYSLYEAEPILRGTVFADRGVYKLGEEVHLKAILRQDTPNGIKLIAANTPIDIVVRDSRSKVIDKRRVKMNDWSTAEWTMTVPADGALGNYQIVALLRGPGDATDAAQATDDAIDNVNADGELQSWESHLRRVYGNFLVAAYRRPDFRVDVTLTGDSPIAGAPLKGVVTGRYLFGAPMATRSVKWTYSRAPMFSVPAAITEKFPNDSFTFIGCCYERERVEQIENQDVTLDTKGQKALDLGTKIDAGLPFAYTLEGEVEDVSRQKIANRTSVTVHPAPWYIGVKSIPYFAEQKDGVNTEIVAVTPDGKVVPGVAVKVALTRRQWHSVRRAEGNGFYTWDSTTEEIEAVKRDVTTAETPVSVSLPLEVGGYYTVTAVAKDDAGRSTTTKVSFYAIGGGYTAWMRYDHNRIELVPERQTYKPGDDARIMIKSPWEHATALVTMEREGVRSYRTFTLTSTQESITVPVTDADIPNVYVSVLLIKGRTKIESTQTSNGKDDKNGADGKTFDRHESLGDTIAAQYTNEDGSDPGKPSFRLGYCELRVTDESKHLTVTVKANEDEYRPATAAVVDVAVKDRQGRAAQSEVTLWAVDYGVLSLTGFKAPTVVDSVYLHKALQVSTQDNRQRIVSRRVLTPKGADAGGGGGEDSGTNGGIRKDFRVLAFWLGSVVTDKDGRAQTTVKLPESLTTYRIMAVSGDKMSRFGAGDSEIRINKPVLLRAAYPRFLAVGDKAFFGSVINSQLKEPGTATVTIRSLDPNVLQIDGAQQTVEIAANGTAEVRFNAMGRTVGRARVQMTVKLNGETDAFEDVVPVEILVSPETVAAYGEVRGATPAKEQFALPAGVVSGVGGLRVELSSTAMVGLGEGARYLVEYPYGCAEQRGSRALALLLAADLGDAFSVPGIEAKELRPTVQKTLKELEKYQCESGGFAYWPGACWSGSPYLTSYLLHVFQVAQSLKYDVNPDMMKRGYDYLERAMARAPQPNEGWWPGFTAWQAFAVKVLVDGGRNEDSHVTRLYGYVDRMPIFALAHLLDAMVVKGEKGVRVEQLRRRITNAILPEGGSAHVEELKDPHLMWFWSSNVRSTSIVLGSLVRDFESDTFVRQTVRWLMSARTKGRWGNTQENAWAMESLVAYYRKYESEVPDFSGVVTLGGEELTRNVFKGRSAVAAVKDVSMKDLASTSVTRDLTFAREGSAGVLFYATRLQYAADTLVHDPLDVGFGIKRQYARLASAEAAPDAAATTFKAGDLIKVTLSFDLTKERRFVAVTDPLPAGVEPVETWFATTAGDLGKRQQTDETGSDRGWRDWWERGGFDHVERHDDRVLLFATRLGEGHHEFSYIVRATTAGTFRTAPAHVEEMYEPEVFGRTPTAMIEVRP